MSFLVLNIFIGIVWLLLTHGTRVVDFGVGFAAGFVLLAAFHPVLGSWDYVRRAIGFLRFLVVFAREFVMANVSIARVVLTRRPESLNPNFIEYDLGGLKPHEVLLLSYCITLTPGTTSTDISEDMQTLIIHSIEADDPEEICRTIDERLLAPILAFTR